MVQVIRFALWLVAKLILPLRYRLAIHGEEELRGVQGPALILRVLHPVSHADA